MIFKRYGFILLTAVLVLSAGLTAFAGEDIPEPVDESKFVPKIALSSKSTVEVPEGTKTEVIIEVRNIGTGRANNFFVQAVPEADYPFTVAFETLGGSDILQAGVKKSLRMTVIVEKGAPGKVYPVELKYSCVNDYRVAFDYTDTINIKVSNNFSASNIRLYNFELVPSSLKAGETAELFFNYMNLGSADERNVTLSLDGLDSSTITVPDGLNSQKLPIVRTYTEEKASFVIMASPSCKNGSYPIKIITTAKDSLGESSTEELTYYINVGGGADTGEASLDVVNPTVPSGVYGVGESFNIGFELHNSSKFEANNVLVKANALEGDTVVPTSQSMFMTRVLSPGETERYSFTFAATSAAKSQNYPVSFTIEYDSGSLDESGQKTKISFSQYFGVSVSNPEADEKEEEGETALKNVPKIIVSSYTSEPTIVKAGNEFDLSMTFMNTHAQKPVRNIKVSLTVTDKDENVSASIFSPVQASNTLFVDEIAPKQTASRSIRYYTVPDAKAQTYSINVNFEYEDAEGNQIKEQEIIGINVSQPPSVEASEMSLPEFSDVGMPISVGFDVINTGKVTINNLRATLVGDMEADTGKSFWIGNLESGSSERVEMSFYYNAPGQYEGEIIVSYDSTTGEHFEIPKSFSIAINEPMPMDFGEFPMDMPEETGFSAFYSSHKPLVIGGGIGVIALAAGGFLGLRYLKKKKESEFDE